MGVIEYWIIEIPAPGVGVARAGGGSRIPDASPGYGVGGSTVGRGGWVGGGWVGGGG